MILPLQSGAQTLYSIDTQSDYYYRLLQVSGKSFDNASFTVRPFEPEFRTLIDHPWRSFVSYTPQNVLPSSLQNQFKTFVFEPVLFQSYNSTLPRGLNDGAIWQGKGYSSALSFGVKAQFGIVHLKFKPIIGFAQNQSYDLGPYPVVGGSEYAYRIRPDIDLVQRFGDSAWSWFDLGDSYLDVRYRGWHAGFSNQRVWNGPATLYPLQFSYQGPGFLHGFIGTYRPVETPIGHFEMRYLYGGVKKSDYFVARLGNTMTSINALIVAYSPSFMKGFTIGGQRQFMEEYPTDFAELQRQITKMVNPFTKVSLQTEDNPRGWEPDNQMAAIFARYVLPKSGFEWYMEFGRNDHNADWRDFRMQPDHLSATVFGIIKTFDFSRDRLLAMNLELTKTESLRGAFTRGLGNNPTSPDQLGLLGSWYTHAWQTVGFTNRGQMLGSGFGPGGNQQTLRADIYYPEGKWGVRLTRMVYHNTLVDNVTTSRNYYEMIIAQNPDLPERWELRNTEFVLAVDHTRMVKYGIEIAASVELSRILNHQYLRGNDLWNTRFELILRKRIKGGLR
jgi:hypothetical protein